MNYRIVIYAPDEHIQYDARTPDREGVGGGIMARIRLAKALVDLGHQVSLIANCPQERTFDGVNYIPLGKVDRIITDVVVPTTSGGALDFSPFNRLEVEAKLRIFWVHGPYLPKGLDDAEIDYVYVPSNYILDVVKTDWHIPPNKTFVTYNGATEVSGVRSLISRRPARDPYALIYASHPSKGLESAIGILRILKELDKRYVLHVYGSRLLWGQQDTEPFQSEPGVVYHGMVPQHEVTQGMRLANFSINLQIRNEGLPLVGVEALKAGCLMLASPVGGYTDIVDHGRNGFLVPGDHLDETTWKRAVDLIQYLQEYPGYANYIRKNAQSAIWDWNTMARSWIGHWEWTLAGPEEAERKLSSELIGNCGECRGQWLPLADGYHCINCGHYSLVP